MLAGNILAFYHHDYSTLKTKSLFYSGQGMSDKTFEENKIISSYVFQSSVRNILHGILYVYLYRLQKRYELVPVGLMQGEAFTKSIFSEIEQNLTMPLKSSEQIKIIMGSLIPIIVEYE